MSRSLLSGVTRADYFCNLPFATGSDPCRGADVEFLPVAWGRRFEVDSNEPGACGTCRKASPETNVTMRHTLQKHVLGLEERIQTLREQLTVPGRSKRELHRARTDIRVAELALDHYRMAHELEQKIGWFRP